MAVAFAVVTVAGVILSMGPEGPTPLYSWLHRGLFGMAAIRAVPRFSVLVLLGIAVLAALAIRSLETRQPRLARGLVVVALLAIGFEYSNGVDRLPASAGHAHQRRRVAQRPARIRGRGVRAHARLARQHAVHAAVARASAVLSSTATAASCRRFSKRWWRRRTACPAADALLAMHNMGVEYVVSDGALAVEPAFGEVLVERARFDDAARVPVALVARDRSEGTGDGGRAAS